MANEPPTRTASLISLVVPLYNERESLSTLWERLDAALVEVDADIEAIFVDDGSIDGTGEELEELVRTDSRVRVVRLSRNFGQPQAYTAGLDHATGDVVITMDGDLQDLPEAIPTFLERWSRGADVVYAVRRERKEGMAKQLAFRAFYRLQARLSEITIPIDAGAFALMDARVVEVLRRMPERARYLPGLRAYAGFRQEPVEVERGDRLHGSPRVTLTRLVKLALDGMFAFSTVPLRVVTIVGFALSVVSVGAGLVALYARYVLGATVLGWQFGLTTIAFMFGALLLTLGVIGEYVGRIYEEVKKRPYYVVDELLGFPRMDGEAE